MRFYGRALLVVLARLFQAGASASPQAELPIEFREGLLWVEVTVPERREPLHFLLDSGASTSVVDLSTAHRLGLQLGPKVRVVAVAKTLVGRWPVRLSAKAGPLELPDEYLALDLGTLSGACGRSVDGLIGADFFRGRVVEIDYTAQRLRMLAAAPASAGANAVPLEIRPCGFRVAVNVDDRRRQWVRVDTGCATAFQWVTRRGRSERCTTKPAVGLAELSIPQTLTDVRIGNYYMDAVPTGLHRKTIFPGEAGLLGNGLLAGFGVVTIDARAGWLFLGPTSTQ